jgi:outer membrane protein assembly factor BamB
MDEACVVTCRDGTVWAVSTADGGDLWRRPAELGGPVSGAAVILPRGFGFDGAAFVAAHDGSVQAIDLASGDAREVLPAGAPIEGSPAVVQDRDALRSFVYVIRSDGSLYSIDPVGGGQELLCQLDDGATGAMAAAPGTVAVADAKGTLHVVDTDRRRLTRRIPTQGQVLGAPVIADRYVYVTSTDGWLRGAPLTGNGGPGDGVRDLLALGAPVHATPGYRAGRLYVGASDGRVYLCDVSGRGGPGPVQYRAGDPLGAEVAGLAVAPGGTAYVAAGYRVVAVDGENAQLRDTVHELPLLASGAPVISDGFCYVTSLGGVVGRAALR